MVQIAFTYIWLQRTSKRKQANKENNSDAVEEEEEVQVPPSKKAKLQVVSGMFYMFCRMRVGNLLQKQSLLPTMRMRLMQSMKLKKTIQAKLRMREGMYWVIWYDF